MTIVLGHPQPALNVCVEHRPYWPSADFIDQTPYLNKARLQQLVTCNSNHWQKIINVYAKLLFALRPTVADSWQRLRDDYLLQACQRHALTMAAVSLPESETGLRLISGKTYAGKLLVERPLEQPLEGVWADQRNNLLITPYFDYRALPNRRIEHIAELIQAYWPTPTASCLSPAQATPEEN